MCHCPWPIYFMPYSLLSSSNISSLHSWSQLSTCCQKKKKSCVTQFESLSLSFPLHCFFVFVFLLEFLICKREKMCSYHSLMCCPISLQRVAHYYKGTGKQPCYATLCCATLCYACSIWWPLWKCRNNAKGLLASRGGLCVFKQGPDWMYTTYPHTKVPQILKVKLSQF